MTVQRVTIPPDASNTHDDTQRSQLSLDLRAAICSDAPLLISGDRDTARLLARVVHDHNPTQRAPRFVSVTHDTLTEKLAAVPVSSQTELGAAIGFDKAEDGLTVFIDDVDRLTPAAQDMLMYYLDVVYASNPVGGNRESHSTRVVAATTRDLTACVAAGTFRSDLLYRLNVIHLPIPPAWKPGERELHTLLATLSG